MSTVTLTSSSWSKSGSTVEVENAAYGYNDTSNTGDGAWIGFNTPTDGYFFYSGFDFSNAPQNVYDIEVKVKAGTDWYIDPAYHTATLYSSASGVQLSREIRLPLIRNEDTQIITLPLTASIATVMSYKNTLGIRLRSYGTATNAGGTSDAYCEFYGAEIVLTGDSAPPVPNKVLYGNTTVIDLSNDTATALDVEKGKTFHLPSGKQTTGLSKALRFDTATAYLTSSSTSIQFTNLMGEPKSFFIFGDGYIAPNGYIVFVRCAEDEQYITASRTNATYGTNTADTQFYTFSYTNGTLTVSSPHFTYGQFYNGITYKLLYFY